jgi:hypothetical protein
LKKKVGRPKSIQNQGTFLINIDRNRFDEFKALCEKKKMSTAEYIRSLIVDELEKNAIGLVNPININYGESFKPMRQMKLTHYKDDRQIKPLIDDASKTKDGLRIMNYLFKRGYEMVHMELEYIETGRKIYRPARI